VLRPGCQRIPSKPRPPAPIQGLTPATRLLPRPSSTQELNFRSTPDVWGYFSVDSSGLVHEFADSQFGHLFAGGPTREMARKSMVLALKELSIRGDIRTTVEYISVLMQVPSRSVTPQHEGCIQNQVIQVPKSRHPSVGTVLGDRGMSLRMRHRVTWYVLSAY
jgi:acetyl/propionyl-CoA carboxylase alpha subunit